jgi:hypothetical protein
VINTDFISVGAAAVFASQFTLTTAANTTNNGIKIIEI